MPLLITSQAGTRWKIALYQGSTQFVKFSGTVPTKNTQAIRFFVPKTAKVGWYTVEAQVQYPGESTYSKIVGTPGCTTCGSDVYISSYAPYLKHTQFMAFMLTTTPGAHAGGETSWGVADLRDHN